MLVRVTLITMLLTRAFNSAISVIYGIISSSQELVLEGVPELLSFSEHASCGAGLVSCDSILDAE